MQQDSNTVGGRLITNYSGALTHKMIISIGDSVKGALSRTHSQTIVKTAFFCLNEMMQNIGHYSAETISEDSKDAGVGYLELHAMPGKILIHTRNKVTEAAAKSIVNRIRFLNQLTREELKREYKAALAQPFRADKKGAGLGLIEILRKSGGNFAAEYLPVDETITELRLHLTIPAGL